LGKEGRENGVKKRLSFSFFQSFSPPFEEKIEKICRFFLCEDLGTPKFPEI
jgi:hypothetical protein